MRVNGVPSRCAPWCSPGGGSPTGSVGGCQGDWPLDAAVGVPGEACRVAPVHRRRIGPGPAAELRASVVLHRLDDLGPRVHHEWAVLCDRLAERATLQQQELGGLCAVADLDRGIAGKLDRSVIANLLAGDED